MVEKVREIAGGTPDLILDTAPISNCLPDLVQIAGGDSRRVLTISDFEGAKRVGARDSFEEGLNLRYDVLGEFAKLAAEGKFTVPIAQKLSLENWRQALDISVSGDAHGKLLLLP